MNTSNAFTRLEEILREASEEPQGPSRETVARVKAL